jgi:O-glycosyl hydrolase
MKTAGLKNILQGILCLVFVPGILSCNFSFGENEGGTVQIWYDDLRQTIDGFGGSNAWTALPSSTSASREVVKLLYSKTEGAGFTILRNRIPFRERLAGDENPGYNDGFITRKADNTYQYAEDGGIKTFTLNWGSWDLGNTKSLIQAIKALGSNGPESLTLMSTPWTPPNNRITNWKLNVRDKSKPDVGGRLAPERYEDYADLLADYAGGFESNMGVPLAVLSVQNEPHWEPDYESCKWTGEEIRDFLIVLGGRFALKNVGTDLGIMAPEDENFREDFITPSLNNAAAKAVLTHVGLHQYEGASDASGCAGAEKLPNVSAAGKRIWQTEVSGSGPLMPGGNGIDNALYYARMIHLDMTLAETNAFLFWWLWTNGGADPAGSLITVNNGAVNPAVRLFVMGQFSRFVRPGWRRIGSTTSPAPGVYSSAYRDPSSGKIAVVLINETEASVNISVGLEGAPGFSSLEAWRTSAAENLEKVSGPDLTGNGAEVKLPAKSVTTLYGDISG